MDKSKRITANIVMIVALIALGTAATFTIINGVDASPNDFPAQFNNESFKKNNFNNPNMNNETPPSSDDNTQPETPNENNNSNNNRNLWPSRRSDSDDKNQDSSGIKRTSTTVNNTAANPPVFNQTKTIQRGNHSVINYLLVGLEFFSMGAITTYLIFSQFNKYTPKEVIKK